VDSIIADETVEENKALARRFYGEILNQKKLEVLPEILSPTIRWHEPSSATAIAGIEEAKAFLKMLFSAVPDYGVQIQDLFGQGDRIAVRWLSGGTHLGEFKGILPTGRDIAIPGISILRLEAGKIAEYWTSLDSMLLMVEIGPFDLSN